ncbi:MAG: histone deacetylase [Betaproteobacteria bacterium]|nr:histone deacetylase [Betaproteobacteria bacterium]
MTVRLSFRPSIPVFYSDHMVAESGGFSPSAAKPAQVMAEWQRLAFPIEVFSPRPVSIEELSAAHEPAFVQGVLAGTIKNGFGNKSEAVASSLRHTSGAMLAAAQAALINGMGAVAPCSGFHHAGYRYASGFCTFNGLMVTVLCLLTQTQVRRVGILDLDEHWGDGTHDIIEHLGLQAQVEHYSPASTCYLEEHAEPFLAELPRTLERFSDCDLVLYQAGADPHVDDPLGGWLTTEQLRVRDQIVFDRLLQRGIPVAWNLAGGYQRDSSGGIQPVLDIHNNTMAEFARAWEQTCEARLAKGSPGNRSLRP